MDFSLNDIQRMLQESAERFVQNDYDFESRRKLIESELGFSESVWSTFAELGWLALPFAEDVGGLDGDVVDMMVLQEQFGRGMVVEPYLPSVVLAGGLIKYQASVAQQETLLEGLVSGEVKFAFAGAEASAQTDFTQIQTTAVASDSGYMLNGEKSVVLGAPSADQFVVAARTSGDRGSAEGLSLFLVDAKQAGVSLKSYTTNNGYAAAEVSFNQVEVDNAALIGDKDSAHAAIERVNNEAIVALASQALGAMNKLLEATVEYSKVRQQFDQPIGNFQVLQHRMVDMFMECEQLRSMIYYAAMAVQANGDDATRAAAMLKVKVGSAGRLVGQHAVQTHGGMGVTDELDVGHFFKHVTMINTLLGSHDFHLQKLINEESLRAA